MEKLRIRCEHLSEEEIEETIKSYVSLGWEFDGILDGFPPNMRWIHLTWEKDNAPIRPGIESNN